MKYYNIIVLAILSIIACNFKVSAQEKEGDIERKARNYHKAISYYRNDNFSSTIALRLAQCYAMVEQSDSAFIYLDIFIEREKEFLPVSTLKSFEEFEKLKKYNEWEKLVEKCKQFNNAYIAKLNIPLRDTLFEMRKIDSSYQAKYTQKKLSNDSVSIQSFKEEWKAAVKENDIKLSKIIDVYGWPTKELVGDKASTETFFMVQHSLDVEMQKKCLVLLKQGFGNNMNDLIQIAYLEDRILVTSGQKQLYGTQYKKGKLYPVQDPENLNKRRSKVGLAPIQFIQTNSSDQNLIPNYSFEIYSGDECPKFLINTDGGWEKVGGESFTLLNDKISHSRNFIHLCKDQPYFNSFSGNAYIRYWTKDLNSDDTPELFQVEMKDTLIKGEEYLIEFYTRIEPRRKSIVTSKNDICVFLSKYKYNYSVAKLSHDGVPSIKENFKLNPDIFFYENRPVEDFSEWTRVSNKYVAKGGEKYFLIGCYGKVKYDCTINLDNITVQRISSNKINIENTKVGETIVLEDILFELNSAKLTNSSFLSLNQIVELFSNYPDLVVEIAGHTDNIGNKIANQELSDKRARAVVNYLISKGVNKDKVQAVGYGDSVPIGDNETEEGRKKNRRVEFKILQR